MIYLIDDKKIRQNANGWNSEKLETFKQSLFPIYNKAELDNYKDEIFNSKDIILFHESFFDNPENKHEKDVDKIRQDLINLATSNKTILVFFSGSIANRTIMENIAYLPTNILYSNLEYFLKTPIDINNIVYGSNFKIEQILLIKQDIWNLVYDLDTIPKNNINFRNKLTYLIPEVDWDKINDIKIIKSLINTKVE